MNLTFFSQKGGVGKSTACILMSDYLSSLGKKILLVDIDPQATLSETFTLEEVDKSFYDVLMGDCLLEEVIIPINENLHLIPANENINKLGNEKESKLYKIARQLQRLSENYDYVLIDSAGNLSSVNAFSILSADKIIMPLQLEKPAFQSTQGTLLAIEETREMIGEGVDILAFYNMVRNPETQIQRDFREAYQELLEGMEINAKILNKDLPLRESIKKRVSSSSNLFEEKLDEKTNDFFKELFHALEIK